MDTSKILEGIQVLDLSSVLAGPQTASFFAELGAKVIKIENKLTDGDVTRQWKLPCENPEDEYSAYYWSANFGKEVQLLDLTHESDKKIVWDLIAQSDIVISNFQKRTAEKLGFCPNIIHKKYPQVIIAQLSAYGYDDPRPGYDLVMQAETGWISMTGTDENNLAKLPVALMDIIAAHQMKEGVLLAMYQKMKTGKGSIVHVSLYKSALSALANQATNYLIAGHVPKPMGTLHPNIAPYGDIFITKDNKRIMLAVGSDGQFEKLCAVLKIEKGNFMFFSTNKDRVLNREELYHLLLRNFNNKNFEEITHELKLKNIPYCFINNLDVVFEQSETKEMVNHHNNGQNNIASVKTIAFQISQY